MSTQDDKPSFGRRPRGAAGAPPGPSHPPARPVSPEAVQDVVAFAQSLRNERSREDLDRSAGAVLRRTLADNRYRGWLMGAAVLGVLALIAAAVSGTGGGREREEAADAPASPDATVVIDAVSLPIWQAGDEVETKDATVAGTLTNRTSEQTIAGASLAYAFYDCPNSSYINVDACPDLAEGSFDIAVEVPPGETRSFEAPLPVGPDVVIEGQLIWEFRVTKITAAD